MPTSAVRPSPELGPGARLFAVAEAVRRDRVGTGLDRAFLILVTSGGDGRAAGDVATLRVGLGCGFTGADTARRNRVRARGGNARFTRIAALGEPRIAERATSVASRHRLLVGRAGLPICGGFLGGAPCENAEGAEDETKTDRSVHGGPFLVADEGSAGGDSADRSSSWQASSACEMRLRRSCMRRSHRLPRELPAPGQQATFGRLADPAVETRRALELRFLVTGGRHPGTWIRRGGES